MPGARISFTCNTADDSDIVAWLDSFGSRDRGYAIKAAIRDYIINEQNPQSDEVGIDRLTLVEDKLSEILLEVINLRKSALAISINNDIINNDLSNEGEIDPEVRSNIGKFLKD